MTLAQTSLAAYCQLCSSPVIGERQSLVYSALLRLGSATDLEITKHLGFVDPNKVRPRRHELVKLELVEQAGVRVCSVSGKLAIVWKCTAVRRLNNV